MHLKLKRIVMEVFGGYNYTCEMRPPNEEKSIIGHLDSSSFEEVYFGDEFKKLRHAHETKNFDIIDYCKNCDFFI